MPSGLSAKHPQPLAGLRVVELSGEIGDVAGQIFSDLGATVLKIQLTDGTDAQVRHPMGDVSAWNWHLRNSNKLRATVDLRDDDSVQLFQESLAQADIMLDFWDSSALDGAGIHDSFLDSHGVVAIRPSSDELNAHDVQVSGLTEHVLYGLSGVLGLSGRAGSEPVLAPIGIAETHVGAQVAWKALAAYWLASERDPAQHECVSLIASVREGLRAKANDTRLHVREEQAEAHSRAAGYNGIFNCVDGFVRFYVVTKEVWANFCRWMGTEPSWASDTEAPTAIMSTDMQEAVEEYCRSRIIDEVVAESTKHDVAASPLREVAEVVNSPQYQQQGHLQQGAISRATEAYYPSGYIKFQDAYLGKRNEEPSSPRNLVRDKNIFAERREPDVFSGVAVLRENPMATLKVCVDGRDDRAVAVGCEFSALGAQVEVLSGHDPSGVIESSQVEADSVVNVILESDLLIVGDEASFTAVHGLPDLPQLLSDRDMCVLSIRAGRDDRVSAANASAMVRARTGIARLWSTPDDAFHTADSGTDFPFYTTALIAATAALTGVLAAKERKALVRTSVAEEDVALNSLGGYLVEESLKPGSIGPEGSIATAEAPSGVFPCEGDDEWCVVSIRDDADWAALCNAVGRDDLAQHDVLGTAAGRIQNRAASVGVLTQWLVRRDRSAALSKLKQSGVPVGEMVKL